MNGDREVELKLEVAPSELRRLPRHPVVQALAHGRAVTRTLESVYFDTEDDALAAAGFAVRVRRSGAERILTVKGERASAAGLFERLEVEVPIESDEPEFAGLPHPDLVARLREILAGRPLAPVFRTVLRRTRRVLRDGDSEWTLDVDEGEILADGERAPINEVELELRSGEPARLFEFALLLQEQLDLVPASRSKAERGYALARGAPTAARSSERIALPPDASVEDALEAILSQCLSHFTANAACACEGLDPEGVHQMRVGVRRTRAALALFQPLLPDRQTRVFRSELRWIGRELGGARDLDVFTREVLGSIEAYCGDDPAFKRLREEAEALRGDCYVGVREVLRSPRYARLVLEFGAWLYARAWRNQPLSEEAARIFAPARELASQLLTRRERKVRRVAKRLGESDEARHALRIQLKKLRYGAEFFRGLFPDRHPKRTLRRIARLQNSLGRMNDVATAHGILQTLLVRLEDERAPAHDRVAGFIEGWTTHEARTERGAFESAWKRLRRSEPFWRI